MPEFCCPTMTNNINHKCDKHTNEFECPDTIIYFSINGYGIIIHKNQFRYWLSRGPQVGRAALRTAVGCYAKEIGSKLKMNGMDPVSKEFKEKISIAMRAKVEQNPTVKKKLIKSELPFAHYYVYINKSFNPGYQWIIEEWENIRKELKDEKQKANGNISNIQGQQSRV